MICMDIEVNEIQMMWVVYASIGCAAFIICCLLSWVSCKHRASHRNKSLASRGSVSTLSNSTTRDRSETQRAVDWPELKKLGGKIDFPTLHFVLPEATSQSDKIFPMSSKEHEERLLENNSDGEPFISGFNITKQYSPSLGSNKSTHVISSGESEATSLRLTKFQLSVDDITGLDHKKVIGEGSFGLVVKGMYAEMDVAIKRFKTKWHMMSVKDKADFRAEINLGMELNHENIIRYYGYIEEPLSVVMEFCPHGSLNDYFSTVNVALASEESWIEKMLKWTNSAARGIDYLHSKDIVHRDIAARNLLLNKHLEIRVSDFGMARLLEIQDRDVDASNQTISTVGPLKWMSPESIQKREYSFKTDVFSFGVTAWEIFTMCSEPYGKLTDLQAGIQVVENNARPDLEKILFQNSTLLELISNCWHKDPAKRPLMDSVIWIIEEVIVIAQSGEHKPMLDKETFSL